MSERDQLRVAIIGCGGIAPIHVSTIKTRCGPVQIHLCDTNRDAARKLKDSFGLETSIRTDPAELFEKQSLDVVHILTPPDTHYTLARRALEAGAHVYVEKPMTLRFDEAEELYSLAEQKSRLLCPGHSLLYTDCVLKACQLIRSGRIGPVIAVHCFFGHVEKQKTIPYRSVSHWTYRQPGGPLVNLISHPASLLVKLLGKLDNPQCAAQARNVMPFGFSDLLQVTIMTSSGTGVFTISMAHGNSDRYLNIQCERGSIYIDLHRQLMIARIQTDKLGGFVSKAFGGIGQGWSMIRETLGVTWKVVTKQLQHNSGVRELVARFHRAVRENGESPVTKDNGLAVAKIVDRVLINGPVSGNIS